MKRLSLFIALFIVALCILPSASSMSYDNGVFSQLKPTEGDIPPGFVFGRVPPFAQRVLKENPWQLDQDAIRKLADRIYPDGDANSIQDIHMTIMSSSERPYGDDIVCYIILFKNGKQAKTEMEKLSAYSGFNTDRTILLSRDNLAVFLLVDDVDHFHLIRQMADGIQCRLNELQ